MASKKRHYLLLRYEKRRAVYVSEREPTEKEKFPN
jgi:hypothetical protein